MSGDNKIRDAADAVKGIVEAVPVYQDAIQPAAKEVGTVLQTMAKTIHVALAPLSLLVWGYDRISEYLETALTERLKGIPPEQIVTPNPSVAVPALEAMRYTAHEPSLRELFANLLATAMDKDTSEKIHPAFVEIIRQMTPDEARIFRIVAATRFQAFPVARIDFFPGHIKNVPYPSFKKLAEAAHVSNLDLLPSGLGNLGRLGIIDITEEEEAIELTAYSEERIEPSLKQVMSATSTVNHARMLEMYRDLGIDLVEECKSMLRARAEDAGGKATHFIAYMTLIGLTRLGVRFYEACVTQKQADREEQ